MEPIVFDSGVTYFKNTIKRGDIYICQGVFKELEEAKSTKDHVVCKPNRPVMVISEEQYNRYIVRVLTLSTSAGNFTNPENMSANKLIKIPSIEEGRDGNNYIDISQVFTINTYQLKTKLSSVSQEIVDAAVALCLFQNMNQNSVCTILNMMKERFPDGDYGQCKEGDIYLLDNSRNPNEQIFSNVKRITHNTTKDGKRINKKYPNSSTLEDCNKLYNEWTEIGTDMFRYKYQLSKQQYIYLRNKCVKVLCAERKNFNKFDWV